jgi:hypothetical protein
VRESERKREREGRGGGRLFLEPVYGERHKLIDSRNPMNLR